MPACGRAEEPQRLEPVASVALAASWSPGPGWPAELIVALNSTWLAQNSSAHGDVAVVDASSGPTLADQSEDKYGRFVQGRQEVVVETWFAYKAVYEKTNKWGYNGGGQIQVVGPPEGQPDIYFVKVWKGLLGSWNALPIGLGGWTLDPHHGYDTRERTLNLGDGSRRSEDATRPIIKTVAGGAPPSPGYGDGGPVKDAAFAGAYGMAFAPDGSYYVADTLDRRIRRVGTDGIINHFVGGGNPADNVGDGCPATNAKFVNPWDVAVGPDGSLYIADPGASRVRRVTPGGGCIETFAGNGQVGNDGDGGMAKSARLNYPTTVAAAPDGRVFIVDLYNRNVRVVYPDKTIDTFAGTGASGTGGDDGPAKAAQFTQPGSVAVGPYGDVYVADEFANRVRRIGTDGIIRAFAGGGDPAIPPGDGLPATQATLLAPTDVAVAPDGAVYVTEGNGFRVRRVGTDGVITTLAGTGENAFFGDGGPAAAAKLQGPVEVAVAPDKMVYILDFVSGRIRRVGPALPGLAIGEIAVASESGNELYVFDGTGRHLRTKDARTGTTLYEIGYQNGLLSKVTDVDGKATTVQRNPAGQPTGITAPFLQTTYLAVTPDGYLSTVANPANEAYTLGYQNGLLTSLKSPRGFTSTFNWNTLGRLFKDSDAEGGSQTLMRPVEQEKKWKVDRTTGMTVKTSYEVETLADGSEKRVVTLPASLPSTSVKDLQETTTVTYPDGTTRKAQLLPDPRWQMQSPLVSLLEVKTPQGLTYQAAGSRQVVLSDQANPLSLVSQTETQTVNGKPTTSVYDAATKTVTTTSPMNRVRKITLDGKGRVTKLDPPGQLPIALAYDGSGRLVTMTQGVRQTAFGYNAQSGALAAVTDALNQTTELDRDAALRVKKQTMPGGTFVQYGHDASGNLVSLTPPGKPSHLQGFTKIDLLGSYTAPDVGQGAATTQYAYNLDRDVLTTFRPDGGVVSFGYDTAGRLQTVTLPGTQGQIQTTYDPATGNVATMEGPSAGVKVAYGGDGFLLKDQTWSGPVAGTVHHDYDKDFRVVKETVNGGYAVDYAYDGDGLLAQAGQLAIARDATTGRVVGTTLGQVTDAYAYDAYGAVETYTAKFGTTTLLAFAYARDGLGRIVQKTETVQGESHVYGYEYYPQGWLKRVTKDGVETSLYTYDGNGNRVSHKTAQGTVTATYDARDRLVVYGAVLYSYNAAGELTSQTDISTAKTTAYSYDAAGNLRTATLPDGTVVAHTVDGSGRRVAKSVGGVMTARYVHGPRGPVARLDGGGGVEARYVYGLRPNVPDYIVSTSKAYRLLHDHLGSPRLTVDVARCAAAVPRRRAAPARQRPLRTRAPERRARRGQLHLSRQRDGASHDVPIAHRPVHPARPQQ